MLISTHYPGFLIATQPPCQEEKEGIFIVKASFHSLELRDARLLRVLKSLDNAPCSGLKKSNRCGLPH